VLIRAAIFAGSVIRINLSPAHSSYFVRMRPAIVLFLIGIYPIVLFASPNVSVSSTGMKKKMEGLDTTKIHALYMNGDFDEAIAWLEKSRKAGWLATHGDSVFAFKHLGVMYAAKYETMERGKQFMYQLLTIEPTVRIMDMFASDMIYMIFHNVQTEYEIRHARPNDTATILANPVDTQEQT
jgi:hypothetical protein